MGSEGGDDSVVAVADALTLRQQVDSDRCAGLVTPAHRRVLDSLCTDIAVICTRTALVLGLLAIAIPTAANHEVADVTACIAATGPACGPVPAKWLWASTGPRAG